MHTSYIVCGSPGAGKSTYARQLAAASCTTLLDIDTVTERLVRLALVQSGHSQDDRDSGYFKQNFREPIYGPFTKEIKDPDWPSRLEHDLGSLIEVHYVQCAREIRRRRLSLRGDARDLAKLKDWENYIQYYGDEHPPVFDHVLVDGSNPEGYIPSE
jgi:hypothetical protein